MKDYLGQEIVAGDEVVLSTSRGFRRCRIKAMDNVNVRISYIDDPGKSLYVAPYKLIKI